MAQRQVRMIWAGLLVTFGLPTITLSQPAKPKPAILCVVPATREAYGTQDLKPPERVAKELKNLGFERGWHVRKSGRR